MKIERTAVQASLGIRERTLKTPGEVAKAGVIFQREYALNNLDPAKVEAADSLLHKLETYDQTSVGEILERSEQLRDQIWDGNTLVFNNIKAAEDFSDFQTAKKRSATVLLGLTSLAGGLAGAAAGGFAGLGTLGAIASGLGGAVVTGGAVYGLGTYEKWSDSSAEALSRKLKMSRVALTGAERKAVVEALEQPADLNLGKGLKIERSKLLQAVRNKLGEELSEYDRAIVEEMQSLEGATAAEMFRKAHLKKKPILMNNIRIVTQDFDTTQPLPEFSIVGNYTASNPRGAGGF